MTYARLLHVARRRRGRRRTRADRLRLRAHVHDRRRASPCSPAGSGPAETTSRAPESCQHVAQPLRGIRGVQRQVRAAGLEHRQRWRSPSPARCSATMPTMDSAPHAARDQVVRQPVGGAVHLPVARGSARATPARARPACAPPAPPRAWWMGRWGHGRVRPAPLLQHPPPLVAPKAAREGATGGGPGPPPATSAQGGEAVRHPPRRRRVEEVRRVLQPAHQPALPRLHAAPSGRTWPCPSPTAPARRQAAQHGVRVRGCRTEKETWKSGCRLRLRSMRSSSTSRSKGTSWCANAPTVPARTRRTTSRKAGSPERSVRRASVLTNSPTIPSVSGRPRPATGEPTTTSSCPDQRDEEDGERAQQHAESSVAPSARRQRVHRVAPSPRPCRTPPSRRGSWASRGAGGPPAAPARARRPAAARHHADLPLQPRPGEPLALPRGVVRVLHGQRRQIAGASPLARAAYACASSRNRMSMDQPSATTWCRFRSSVHSVLAPPAAAAARKSGPAARSNGAARLLVRPPLRLALRQVRREHGQVAQGKRERRGRHHHLQGRPPSARERRCAGTRAGAPGPPARAAAPPACTAPSRSHAEGHGVDGAPGEQPVQEPHPLLRERQRQRPVAVHRGRSPAPRPPAGRACGVDARRHLAQPRRLEDGADRQVDAQGAADARQQLHGQQRVPAQVEEAVFAPRAVHAGSSSAQMAASARSVLRHRRAHRAGRGSSRSRARRAPCGPPCRWASAAARPSETMADGHHVLGKPPPAARRAAPPASSRPPRDRPTT